MSEQQRRSAQQVSRLLCSYLVPLGHLYSAVQQKRNEMQRAKKGISNGDGPYKGISWPAGLVLLAVGVLFTGDGSVHRSAGPIEMRSHEEKENAIRSRAGGRGSNVKRRLESKTQPQNRRSINVAPPVVLRTN